MANSLCFWKKGLVLLFFCEFLFCGEIYIKTDKKIDGFEEYQLLSEDTENCGISIEIKDNLEEKLLFLLGNINYFKAINFDFKEIRDPFWTSYLLKYFSLYSKSENPSLKIFLTGNLMGLDEDIEWYFDGIEGAKIFSKNIVETDKGIKEWLKLNVPLIIAENPEEKEFLFFHENLREGFFYSDFSKVIPEEIIPLLKEDLSFYLTIPPYFKGLIFISGEYFDVAYNLKREEIKLKKERDGTSFYYETKEDFDLISLKREGGKFFYESEEFKGKKIYSLQEILSKLQLYFFKTKHQYSYYKTNSKTNLNISFGGFSKPFYVKINGITYFESGEEKLWEWEEVEVEGASYKGKNFPPIPVLQPEKVKINPFYLYPKEEYFYEISKISEEEIVLNFEPILKKDKPVYSGKIYIDIKNFFPKKIERKQLNLKDEFLSLEEEIFFEEKDGVPLIKNYKGKEVLSILGGITYVEVDTNFGDFEKIKGKIELDKEKIYYLREEKGWRPSKEFPERFLTFGLLKFPDENFPLPLGGISWISLKSQNQYNYIFAGILGTFNKTYFKGRNSFTLEGFLLLYPFSDYPYKKGKKMEEEGLEIRPFSFNFSSTFPFSNTFNIQTKLGLNYLHFESAKEKNENYSTPPSSFTFSEGISLNLTKKGYLLSAMSEVFQRSEDFKFGYERKEGFKNGKKWGILFGKNFKIKNSFLHFDTGYYSGSDLDRFSKYKSGIFGGLEMEGFPSGSISSDKIFISHLNYNFSFLFAKNLNIGLDYLKTIDEKKDYYSIKFSSFFNLYNFLIQLQGGFGIKGEGKGFSFRTLFFKAI